MKTTISSAAAKLFPENGFPLITIYMPTHRAGSDIWQDPIRFKNLMRAAEHDLETAGLPRKRRDALLQPLAEMRDDREFWQYQADGLAVFRSDTGIERFHLPVPVPELHVVGSRYHLKPLLMSMANRQNFYVLALSQKTSRLFRGSPNGLDEVTGLVMPEGLPGRANGQGASLQSHSTGNGGQVKHGAELDRKPQLAAYCRQVDKAIREAVGDNDPLIVASVDQLAVTFREVSSSPGLLATVVSGNPDTTSKDQLFETALPLAMAHFDRRRLDAEEQFLRSIHSGRGLDQTGETIRAARQGRIETLFVPVGLQVWGQIDGNGALSISDFKRPQDQDLLNLALIDTWKSGGQVFAVAPENMPGGRTIAAVARF